MLKKILIGVGGLLLVGVVFAAGGLTWAHLAIRRERAPLPAVAEIVSAVDVAGGPVRLTYINTASQPMPRSAVLDPGRDPAPALPYVMSHPSFVLEWADGRLMLIDVGMTHEGLIAFGRPLEMLAGAAPIQALGSTRERLGAAADRVQGVIFTHLHTDHVGGIGELCAGRNQALPVFMTEAQEERPNYTTRPGLSLLREAGCVRQERLSGGPLMRVPGFPGVFVIAAGGHTPGSQIIVAAVKTADGVRRYAFVGDTVNNIDGINHDVPKPFLYRWLMVPEDGARQAELRGFLRDLGGQGFTLLVAHDQRHIEDSGVAAW